MCVCVCVCVCVRGYKQEYFVKYVLQVVSYPFVFSFCW